MLISIMSRFIPVSATRVTGSRKSTTRPAGVRLVQSKGPLARYVKLRVVHAPGMPGTFFPPPRFSDPDMHHGTCVTDVPRCMPGSLTNGFLWSPWRENVPGIPDACATRDFVYLVRGPWCSFAMLRKAACVCNELPVVMVPWSSISFLQVNT